MLKVTQDMVLPTTMTWSYPKPNWYDQNLRWRAFKTALGDSQFREQYLDAVSTIINDQEMAGLDIVTDGDTRFDLEVGGKSWFFYVLERLVLSTDCGFGRAGLSRRIAYYKCVSLVLGANIVRRELGHGKGVGAGRSTLARSGESANGHKGDVRSLARRHERAGPAA